ncbi:MAG: TIGR03560 family F420-dependent LLM class oxidoreductase [Chloroflexota bacterium]
MDGSVRRSPRFSVQLQAQRTTWPEYIAAVRAVEELGFHGVWNLDHMLPFDGADDGPCFETWTTLAAMAASTNRIRLGSLVNGVIYRDPATLAKSAVMVDQISNGRFEFALGAAWAEREFRAYGLPFPPIGERMDRLEETLTIVKSLWTLPRTTFKGVYYTMNDAPCEPKPVQRPYPPILIGGTGARTIRKAARHADEWNGVASPETARSCIEQLRANCGAIGRDFNELTLSIHPQLFIDRDHDRAEGWGLALAKSQGKQAEAERGKWLIGTPAEVRSQIGRFTELGISHFIMAVGAPFDLDALRLFADEVLAPLSN